MVDSVNCQLVQLGSAHAGVSIKGTSKEHASHKAKFYGS